MVLKVKTGHFDIDGDYIVKKKSNLPKYEDLKVKDYYIIHFDFWDKSIYRVLKYQSKKIYSVKKMWQELNNMEEIYTGYAPHIEIYWDLLKKYDLNEKRTHRLMTFPPIR